MKLWEYLDTKAELAYMAYAEAAGANTIDEHEPEYICNLGDQYEKFYAWLSANRDLCQEKAVEVRPWHTGETRIGSGMPKTVGLDKTNTWQYDWGVLGDSNAQLKELIGGPTAFEKMGFLYDYSLCRLLVQMPGSVVPWHSDTMQGWRDMFADLDPHLVMATEFSQGMTDQEAREQSRCSAGLITRRIVAITDWHWGHFIEMKRTFITDWKSGDVWDSPPAVWHLTGNAGVKLRISMTITGVLNAT